MNNNKNIEKTNINKHYEALEFSVIIAKLQEYTLSDGGRAYFEKLAPYLSEDICIRKMAETTSARKMLDSCGLPPLSPMIGLEELLITAETGAMLIPEQLTFVAQFAASCKRLVSYLEKGAFISQSLVSYASSLADLSELKEEIERSIREDTVHDDASSELRSIRRKMENTESQIKEKLSRILSSRKEYLADSYITNKNGHYVVPVKRQFQSSFGGTVIEISGKGSTVFMEPSSISKLQSELIALSIDEDCEIRRILYLLSAKTAEYSSQIKQNIEIETSLDILFAKAKLSASMNAHEVEISSARKICIKKGRHPLLEIEKCVPLDFIMEENTSGVIITGPNTGGKTVAIKTVGLLSLMAQCGLHIPCEKGSYIAIHDNYLCDIGDSQNISQNLSTFSGHMTNIIDILEQTSSDSLVLMDELGSGTDPAEGMGIAIAVLEELRRRSCMFLVTTHYPQVKNYAEQTESIQSARMAFDKESLRPLYQLELGKSGESCALHIAKKLGLAPHLLERAHREVYGEYGAGNTSLYDGQLQAKMPHVEATQMEIPKSRLIRSTPVKEQVDLSTKFQMGDSVLILPSNEIGIVYKPADSMGNVIVQVKEEKKSIKHNRLKLHVSASELYPPDYDFSIIFDTVEQRKAHHVMNKRYAPGLSIEYEE